MPNRIFRRCRVIILPVIAAILVGFVGCRGEDKAPSDSVSGGRPAVVEFLGLMPESAVTTVATPSIRALGENLEGFLVRASPESINMEAEIRVVVQQLGRTMNIPDARSLEDIAFELGLDPERPVALFLAGEGQPLDDETNDEPAGGAAGSPTTPSPYFNGDKLGAFAVAAHALDAEVAERAVRQWLGDAQFGPEPTRINDIRMHFTTDDEWGYFIRDEVFVFGSASMVAEIPPRFAAPVPVRYGSEECPSDPSDCLVQLTRLDRLNKAQSEAQDQAREALPSQLSEPVTDVLSGLQSLAQGPDPLIGICRVTDTRVDILARLDREYYPAVAEWRGPAEGLPHLALVPEDAVAVLSWSFDGTFREMTLNAIQGALATDSENPTPFSSMGNALGPLLQLLQGNMTIAVTRADREEPSLLFLANVTDGDSARAQLRESGLMPLVSETYNGIDICLLPVPVPLGDAISYALPGNTFVLSTDLARLKSAIDTVEPNRTTGWLARQVRPPIGPRDPLFTALVIEPRPFAGAVLPQFSAHPAFYGDNAAVVETVWEKIREIRFTSGINGTWQEGRLSVVTD
jgi:hypothetical protein